MGITNFAFSVMGITDFAFLLGRLAAAPETRFQCAGRLAWNFGGGSKIRFRSFPRNSDEAKPRRAVWTGGVLGLGPAVPYRSLVGENDEPGDGRDLSRMPELR
jgi:hypothetical protein